MAYWNPNNNEYDNYPSTPPRKKYRGTTDHDSDYDNQGKFISKAISFTSENNNPVYIMHQGFKKLEERYATVLVSTAMAVTGKPVEQLKVLDIGFGLGYSAQKFIDLGVRYYTCLEVNNEIYNRATNWKEGLGKGFENVQIIFTSWEEYFRDNPNNLTKNKTVVSIQGVPLFGNLLNINSNWVVNDNIQADTTPLYTDFDSIFTNQLYDQLKNNANYFKVYYQFYENESDEENYEFDNGTNWSGPFDIIYYSPSDDFGNTSFFSPLGSNNERLKKSLNGLGIYFPTGPGYSNTCIYRDTYLDENNRLYWDIDLKNPIQDEGSFWIYSYSNNLNYLVSWDGYLLNSYIHIGSGCE